MTVANQGVLQRRPMSAVFSGFSAVIDRHYRP